MAGWRKVFVGLVGLALVVASVGVTAGPVEAAPLPLGSPETASPAVTSLEPGRTDVFWRLSNGHLAHRYRPAGGSWTRRLDLGGSLVSQPTVVSTGPGRVHVFARGQGDVLLHRSLSGGRWSAWESLTGPITSAPAVTSSGSGRLDVMARGTDNRLRHRSFTAATGWTPWRAIGGIFTSSPAIVATATGTFHVVARARDNGIRHRTYTNGTWSAWENLGGVSSAQPAVAAPAAGRLSVVLRSADGTLRINRFTAGGSGSGWSGWLALGGSSASGPGAWASGGVMRVASQNAAGMLNERAQATPTTSFGPWTAIDPLQPFRGLGTWVDVFDYPTLDPATAVADMRARGVRTLYLSTARFNGTTDLFDAAEAGEWLDEAHAAGIDVVGWYLPAYGDMARDVRRSLAIADFTSPGGQRFDAVGIDIERLDEVTLTQFNSLLVTHLGQVRAGTDAMIASIVPSPFTTDPPNRWAGFPWSAMAARSDVVIPMVLWSFRGNANGTAYTPDQVYAYVRDEVQRARSLTGGRPLHVEGGVDDPATERTPVTAARVARFVDAVGDAGAIGGSHYDYATTLANLWPALAGLN